MAGEIAPVPPKTFFQRIKFAGLGDAFRLLGKASINTLTGNAAGAQKNLVDASKLVGLKTTEEELLWQLTFRALSAAVIALMKEHRPWILQTDDALKARAELAVTEALAGWEVTFPERFFDAPDTLSLLKPVAEQLRLWLIELEFEVPRAASVSARLAPYFVDELAAEWRKEHVRYEPLREAIEHPFTRATGRIRAWRAYRAHLYRKINESVFGDTLSLLQLYQPLNAWNAGTDPETGERNEERHVFDLDAGIKRWLGAEDKDDAIRLIAGGPGAGKSSFAKMLAARLGQADERVVLIPLHLFNIGADFSAAVKSFLKDGGILTHDLFQDEGRPLFIIFDGLDELVMQGQSATEAVDDLLVMAEKAARRFNHTTLRLRMLFLGREVVVDHSARMFRQPGQVIRVLPYTGHDEKQKWIDPDELLKTDRRADWWAQFGALRDRDFADVLPKLDTPRLKEITAQPLLNYLAALSYEGNHLDLNRTDVRLNEVYAGLIEAVYKRDYESGVVHASLTEVQFRDFERFLQMVGIAAWHGEGRSATVNEIDQHCPPQLKTKLKLLEKGAEAGVGRLLTAFYFRRYGDRQGHATFEFTHQSFGEYLVARRLYLLARMICDEADRHDETGAGWSLEVQMTKWLEVCGPATLTPNMVTFIREEASTASMEDAQRFQKRLASLLTHVIEGGFPIAPMRAQRAGEVMAWDRNAGEALLVMLHGLALKTEELSQLNLSRTTSFGDWLKRQQGQRENIQNQATLGALGLLGMDGYDLRLADLLGAELDRSSLRDANLLGATLTGSSARGADFSNACLSTAYLESSYLQGAVFDGAVARASHWERARLTSSSMRDLRAREANFEGAKMSGADLEGALLDECTMQEADLTAANFADADLSHADLSGADFRGSNLRRAILDGADLQNTRFFRQDIERANLDSTGQELTAAKIE